MVKILVWSIIVVCFSVSSASSTIYKCVGEDGVSKFSDEPCGENVEVVVRNISVAERTAKLDESLGHFSAKSFGTQSPKGDTRFKNRLKFHAKSMGELIFPNIRMKDLVLRSSEVKVYYDNNNEEDVFCYAIAIRYGLTYDKTGYWVARVSTVSTYYLDDLGKNYYIDPPVMNGIANLKKTGKGRWKVK